MDKISFTGIKNVSFFTERFRNYNDVFTEERWLSAELTGRDLHKFQRAMKRSNMDKSNYTNPVRDNFININTYSIPNEDAIAINNNLLEVNDETLPMFTELARITRKIFNKKDSKFVCDEKYLDSDCFNKVLFIDKKIDDLTSTQFHMPENAKNGAKKINNVIQKIMERYFQE